MDHETYRALLSGAPDHLKETRAFQAAGLKAPGVFLYGLGAGEALGRTVSALTVGRKVLLISDAVLDRLGLAPLVAAWLAEAGFAVTLFTDVEPEPHLETVEKVSALARRADVSAIVGLGGGSVLDVAKVAALSLGTGRMPADIVRGHPRFETEVMAPLVLVPTTSGTGSETSIFAVVTDGTTKRSLSGPALVPQAAILDPLLTVSMPASVTAMTGMDALTHAIEAVMHTAATPMCDALSFGAIALLSRSIRTARAEPQNLAARYDMAVGSALAMMSFNLSGGLWAHSVSYVLGSYNGTPHGLGCALGLPCLMDFNRSAVPQALAGVARAMGVSGDPARAIQALMADLGLPVNLAQHKVSAADLRALSEEMARLYPRAANPRPMNAQESLAYWQAMYEGRLSRESANA
ncbi:iron-containing alcohol dehydrogenase [Rhizobiaceae bacterium BDR2-2]|uniref:Iron-containing alcohol dehydrogenase n=1 Tax=Ectorhizobium quercum TaxID=2965071 RepID=A0AAE3SYJ0_9HYPH|nr:iron-containing alcohol dehydrogenase [Ectorhizobium quercum]MCX8999595.1 iron-containing alcohol dehydrogenase [Ectorhizobium quercum]